MEVKRLEREQFFNLCLIVVCTGLAYFLTGCCMARYPLDGKAQSSCEREGRAEFQCSGNGGVESWGYGSARCRDGTERTID